MINKKYGFLLLLIIQCCHALTNSKNNVVPVAIIGSGPAGLSAALFSAREQYYTVVFEGPQSGGVLTDTEVIENWPGIMHQSGKEIMGILAQQVQHFGGIIAPLTIESVDFKTWPFKLFASDGQEIRALTVIIATGVQPRKTNVEGEKKYWGKGVSGCTRCDAPFTKDHDVIIIGGGNTALEQAMALSTYARSITIVTSADSFHARPALVQKLQEHRAIKTLFGHEPIEIKGTPEKITDIRLKNIKTAQIFEIPAQWVFLAMGSEPNSKLFRGILKQNEQGIIQVDCYSQATSMPGIFAAGRVANARYKLGAIASGEGIKAALDAITFLEGKNIDAEKLAQYKDAFFLASAPERKEIAQITTPAEWQKILSSAAKPILLEFFSAKCPHCQKMAPIVQEIAAELGDQIVVVQSELEKAPDLGELFTIKSIPTFILFENKNEVSRRVGATSKDQLIFFAKNKKP